MTEVLWPDILVCFVDYMLEVDFMRLRLESCSWYYMIYAILLNDTGVCVCVTPGIRWVDDYVIWLVSYREFSAFLVCVRWYNSNA